MDNDLNKYELIGLTELIKNSLDNSLVNFEKEFDHDLIVNTINGFMSKFDKEKNIKIEVDEEKSSSPEALENKEIHLNISGSSYDDYFCELMANVYGYDVKEFTELVRNPVEYISINLLVNEDGCVEFGE